MATPKPKATVPASNQNILQALILHQHQQAAQKAQEELKKIQDEHKKLQAEHEATKKKKELDDKLHKETRKELHKLKSQFDGNYAFEQKSLKRETMQRARLAKGTAKKTVQQKQKEARNAKKVTKPRTTSANSRKTTSRSKKSH